MEKYDIYKDVAERTGGDVYVGVVGPVRTGKSTFITKFMESLVIPNINAKLDRQIATDEMPQSADGKAIMTTQPKFVPAEAVKVQFKNKATANVRLIDCVGYMVDGALGADEEGKPRLVKTPWSEEELPFNKAAEMGTKKVIKEYSTVGVVVTTDGSIGDIPRENYISAEERVIKELKKLNKPFVVLLNSKNPDSEETLKLASDMEEKYDVFVVAENVLTLTADKIGEIMEKILLEFPVYGFNVSIPDWMRALPADNAFIEEIISEVKDKSRKMSKMKDFGCMSEAFEKSDHFLNAELEELKAGEGVSEYSVKAKSGLFYKVLSEECGEDISGDYALMSYIKSFSDSKREYSKIKDALNSAKETGYGVVFPSLDEMNLEEPVLVKQGGKYGVKLKANAPSLHILQVDVSTEVSPFVGTEKQGEDLVNYLMSQFEDDPAGIWKTDIFGKSLNDLVKEGLANKLAAMPKDAQGKMRKTLTRVVNENKGGLICILL